jgi:hypothetical protein
MHAAGVFVSGSW